MTSDLALIFGCLAGSLALVAAMFVFGGRSNLLFYIATYFVFFAFGPIINLLQGDEVYFGTVLNQVGSASVGFLLAVLAIFVVDRYVPQRSSFDFSSWTRDARSYPLVGPVLTLLAVYGYGAVLLIGPSILDANKHAKIDALGPGHRGYLFIQFCAVALWFVARHNPRTRKLYFANFGAYTLYCLVSSERDFVFAAFAVLLVSQVVSGVVRLTHNIALGGILLAFSVMIFADRSGNAVTSVEVFNQGSILFVDTYVRSIVPRSIPFEHGATYVNSIVNLLPSWVYTTNFNLASWLKSLYAPGGDSGYGFSMTGEAYLNFGVAGIPAVFALVALAQRWITNRLDKSIAYGYYAVYFSAVLMYAMRGDSLALFKSVLYGALFYAVIAAVRGRRIDVTVDDEDGGSAKTDRTARTGRPARE